MRSAPSTMYFAITSDSESTGVFRTSASLYKEMTLSGSRKSCAAV